MTSHIAVIANRTGLDSQTLLSEAVARWREAGIVIAGLLAKDSESEGSCSAAFLRDIATGRSFSIQLDAAPAGTACHLDTAGLDEACAVLLPRIASADLIVLSKFGKTEAGGSGLWAAFSGAIAAGKPLLTTVSPKHAAAFHAFAPDAVALEPDMQSLERWRQAAMALR